MSAWHELDDAHLMASLLRGEPYLDVRTAEEFALGHIPGAYNIPWQLGTLAGFVANHDFIRVVLATFAAGNVVILGCQSGGRARSAASHLAREGLVVKVDSAGLDGPRDAFGRRLPGWRARGHEVALHAAPGRTYDELVALASATGEVRGPR